jgi:hypothetical protein
MPKQQRQILEKIKSKEQYFLEFETNKQIQESCITIGDKTKEIRRNYSF